MWISKDSFTAVWLLAFVKSQRILEYEKAETVGFSIKCMEKKKKKISIGTARRSRGGWQVKPIFIIQTVISRITWAGGWYERLTYSVLLFELGFAFCQQYKEQDKRCPSLFLT